MSLQLSNPLLWCSPFLQLSGRGQSLPLAGFFTLPISYRATAQLYLHSSAILLVSPCCGLPHSLSFHNSSHSASPPRPPELGGSALNS